MRTPSYSTRVASIDEALLAWPRRPKAIVKDLIDKYGMPHEATPAIVSWHYTTPWRRIIVYREGVQHNFPSRHTDYLKQTIAYRVPPNKSGDLLLFNGSILVDRTRGELAARCGSEGMNFLLINLANDIVQGKLSVNEARTRCSKLSRMINLGWPESYSQGLQFGGPTSTVEPELASADPDKSSLRLF